MSFYYSADAEIRGFALLILFPQLRRRLLLLFRRVNRVGRQVCPTRPVLLWRFSNNWKIISSSIKVCRTCSVRLVFPLHRTSDPRTTKKCRPTREGRGWYDVLLEAHKKKSSHIICRFFFLLSHFNESDINVWIKIVVIFRLGFQNIAALGTWRSRATVPFPTP